ncbi:MAG TPA: cyclodeaminase/cyclohydrolase family protein [Tepidisphaeraceae bacterium]|jgi:formiminotetrahydrofolate cyclodeaminase
MYDAKTSLDDFLNATAARQPAPGGGSVTALVGALSASIGEMVLNYSIGKAELAPYEDELKPALAELTQARRVLLELMVEDQAAYEALSRARKLPAGSKERQDEEPAAVMAAIRVPQAIAATTVAVLELADRVVNFVNFQLLSDLAICADLSMAATRCAIYNVRVNVNDTMSAEDRRAIESSISRLLSQAAVRIQQLSPRIWARHAQGV